MNPFDYSRNTLSKIVSALLLFSALLCGQATQLTVSGTVQDASGTTLPGANVFIKGRLDGAMSDADGRFTFFTQADTPLVLVCSYVGYRTFERELALTPVNLKITLHEAAIAGEEVLVTASMFSTGEGKGVTLTPLEVVTTPGAAADVFWAIKTFPGVQQVEEGAGLFVRGGDVTETAVILDGAYLNHPYRYESPNGGFFGTINPFLLKEIFFSSGGYDVQYGNALSAALVMESNGMPLQRQATLGAGLAAFSAMVQQPLIPEKLGVSFSGNYSNTSPLFRLNGHRREFSQFPRAYDVNLNSVYQYSPKGSLKLFIFQEADDIGIEITEPGQSDFFRGDTRNRLINLRWRQFYGDRLLVSANTALSDFRQDQQLGALDLVNDEQLYQFRLTADLEAAPGIQWVSGLELFRNNMSIDGRVPAEAGNPDPAAPFYEVATEYGSDRAVLFSRINRQAARWRLQVGARLENDSQSGQSFIDPRASLTLDLTPGWHLVLSGGRFHQFARPLFYDPFIGNTELQAMSAWHYISGLVYQDNTHMYRAELYYKDYQSLLLEDALLNYSNGGDGFARGIDLFYKRNWATANGWISYSYLDSERHWMDAPATAAPVFDITHNLTAVLEYSFAPQWQAGASYRYATGKPYTSALGRYHDQRVPDYHKLDLSFSYLRRFFPGNLSVFYLAISNALGRENIFDYVYSNDFQEREAVKATMLRSVYFGVSVSF